MYPDEYKKVGIHTDNKCFHLLEYLYGGNSKSQPRFCVPRSKNAGSTSSQQTISTSATMLIGAKLLQLAATNCTHGGHKNTPRRKANQGTEWKMFHNLFKEHTAQSRRASWLWGRLDRG